MVHFCLVLNLLMPLIEVNQYLQLILVLGNFFQCNFLDFHEHMEKEHPLN